MTSTATDPCLVLVYVDNDADASAVKKDDISEWLAILGEVGSVKLQYDVSKKANCFSVVFKQARTAQQAVQYLDGQRLKGCTIHIRSTTFKRVDLEQKTDATSGSGVGKQNTTKAIAAKELPHNHLVPKDVRMDAELVGLLPTLSDDASLFPDVAGLWEKLKASQARLAAIMDELDACTREAASMETTTSERLAGLPSTNTPRNSTEVGAPTSFRAGMPIPFHRVSPTNLVARLSESFGPLAVTSFVPFLGESGSFALSVQFWMREDAKRFSGCLAWLQRQHTEHKRPRDEEDNDAVSGVDRDLQRILEDARFVGVGSASQRPFGSAARNQHVTDQLLHATRDALRAAVQS